MSSVTCGEGKIYVADYKEDTVKVFSFSPGRQVFKEKVLLTRISKPLKMQNATEEIQHAMARKLTLEQLKDELAKTLNVDKQDLEHVVQIEAEKVLDNGQLQLTISLPKKLVPEGVDLQEKK